MEKDTEVVSPRRRKSTSSRKPSSAASASTTPNLAKYVYTGDRSVSFPIDVSKSKSVEKKAGEDEEEAKTGFNAALFGSMVQKGFKRLYDNKDLSDITFILDPKGTKERVHAHKMVLCAWSETFRAMLNVSSSWKESRMKELPIELDDQKSYINFKLMLKYMYTGETNFIKGHNILDLIALSNYYGIYSLKELCGEILGDLVDDENLLFFLDIVDAYDVKQLEAACGEHLAENFGELLDEGKLDELEPSTWAEMLRSDNIQIRSEEQLFEAVMSYGDQFYGQVDESGVNKRDEVLTLLLPFIRWPFVSAGYLVEVIERDTSIQHLPIVHELIHEAFRYKVYPDELSKDSVRMRARVGFRFDKNKCHGSITLSEDGKKATLQNTGGWMNVVCVEEMTPVQNYIEWKVETGGNMMLGAVLGTCLQAGYAGQWQNGWTYYSPGQIYHANTTPVTGQTYGQGDVIGMSMDFDNGKLTWYKNGTQSAQIAGVNAEYGEGDNGLRPVACFSQQNACVIIQVNSGEPGGGLSYKKKSHKSKTRRKPSSASTSSSSSSEPSSSSSTDVTSPSQRGKDQGFIRSFLKF